MKNSKGSALAVALSSLVLFTGLGLGALNYSGMQGLSATNQTLSTQAFWVAEAGLQKALTLVETYNSSTVYPVILPADSLISTGSYLTNITLPVGEPWSVKSTGSVSSVNRDLFAKIGYGGLTKAISTTGTITVNGNPTISSFNENVAPVLFDNIFGISMTQATQSAESTSTCYNFTASATANCGIGDGSVSANGKDVSIPLATNKLAYVKMDSNQTLKISGNGTASDFLVVEGGTLDMTGGGGSSVNFSGIIWVEGGNFTKISGSEQISGAIYINSSSTTVTTINGSAGLDILFDQNLINTVINKYGSSTIKPKILCWSEVSC